MILIADDHYYINMQKEIIGVHLKKKKTYIDLHNSKWSGVKKKYLHAL